jgi:RNA polymerase sigma factor (TIGR02999 family)
MPTRITLLLERWRQGDECALNELMPLIYDELHRIAKRFLRGQRPDHTLQPTALVNEACLKMFDAPDARFADRAHFLAVASRAMRQVLVDHARAGAARKRGGGEQRVAWDDNIDGEAGQPPRPLLLLDLDRVLADLTREQASLGRLVEMHYFGGMTAEEIAEVTGRSAHTIRHELRAARAWLRRELAH